jgi:hypothetical protein
VWFSGLVRSFQILQQVAVCAAAWASLRSQQCVIYILVLLHLYVYRNCEAAGISQGGAG